MALLCLGQITLCTYRQLHVCVFVYRSENHVFSLQINFNDDFVCHSTECCTYSMCFMQKGTFLNDAAYCMIKPENGSIHRIYNLDGK